MAACLTACASTPFSEAPRVDSSTNTTAFKSLPPDRQLIAISNYEFRSIVRESSPRGGTDMFKSAMFRSGQFRVVKRARLKEGVVREKQLNASGLSSGKSASEMLTSAKYIFEGANAEAKASETQRSGLIRVASAEFDGGSSNRDVLAIDVRVVDVVIGDIVIVRKSIGSDATSGSGIGNLIGTVLSKMGKSTPLFPMPGCNSSAIRVSAWRCERHSP